MSSDQPTERGERRQRGQGNFTRLPVAVQLDTPARLAAGAAIGARVSEGRAHPQTVNRPRAPHLELLV